MTTIDLSKLPPGTKINIDIEIPENSTPDSVVEDGQTEEPTTPISFAWRETGVTWQIDFESDEDAHRILAILKEQISTFGSAAVPALFRALEARFNYSSPLWRLEWRNLDNAQVVSYGGNSYPWKSVLVLPTPTRYSPNWS